MTGIRAALAGATAAAVVAAGTVGSTQAIAAPHAPSLATSQAASQARSHPPTTRLHGVDVDATTIPQLQRLMRAHRLSSVDLVRFYLARIRVLNPKLHAVITVSRTAVADARKADRARAHGDRRPLLGIRVIVKD